MKSARHLSIDQRTSIHRTNEVGTAIQPLRTDAWIIPVFGHHCLRHAGRIWWGNFMSYSEVRCRVLGPTDESLTQTLNQNGLRLYGHVLRFSCRTLFPKGANG